VSVRRLAVGGLVLIGLFVVGMPGAQAHADLLSSDPAGGSTLATAPTELRLTYSEAPDPTLSAVALLNSGASPVATGTPRSTAGQRSSCRSPTPSQMARTR
jgi:methionine-rich copper-binding protein CopC